MRIGLPGLLVVLLAMSVEAAVVAATPRGIVVAHDGLTELFDHQGRRTWTGPGVTQAGGIVVGNEQVAIIDPWANRARVVNVIDGTSRIILTGESPVAGVFVDETLFLVERDARSVARFGADGVRTAIEVGADPAFIGVVRDRVYVYSRRDGLIQEIEPPGRIARTLAVGPFASDMVIDGATAYLVFPREARLVTVDLEKLELRRRVQAGGSPVAVAVVRPRGALSAAHLAVADPASKRLWITEGLQSFGAAFGRGFVRGLIGLGLFRPRSTEFPTGIDRVMSAPGVTLAYDSAARIVYRVDGPESRAVAEGIAFREFTAAGGRLVLWRDGALHFLD